MPGGILLLNLKLSNLFAELIMQSAKIKYNWYDKDVKKNTVKGFLIIFQPVIGCC